MDGDATTYEVLSLTLVVIAGVLAAVSLIGTALIRRRRNHWAPREEAAIARVRGAAFGLVEPGRAVGVDDGASLAEALASLPRRARPVGLRHAASIVRTVELDDGAVMRRVLVDGGVEAYLTRMIRSDRSAIRQRGLLLAGDLGWTGAIDAAEVLLERKDSREVLAAAVYLDRVGALDPVTLLRAWASAVGDGPRSLLGALVARQGRSATRILCHRATDQADVAGIALLSDCVYDPLLAPTLVTLLADPRTDVRVAAARVCCVHVPVGFAAAVRIALQDDCPEVRAAMSSVALRVGIEADTVAEGLDDADARVREAAAMALASTPDGVALLAGRPTEVGDAFDLGRSVVLQQNGDAARLAAVLTANARRRLGTAAPDDIPDFLALLTGRPSSGLRLADVEGPL